MTPKEFDFMTRMIHSVAVAAYNIREAEVKAGKAADPGQFVLDNRHKLLLKKQLDAFTKGKAK